MRLAEHLRGRDNNLNLLRFLAASAVIISHSYVLVTGSFDLEPLRDLLGMSLGDLAVDLFFVISGLLVTGSLAKRDDLPAYFLARVRRIYPGLLVMLLLVNLPLGLWLTSLSATEYLTSPGLRGNFVHNTILVVRAWTGLPGVLEAAPWPGAINGSLWTLTYEIRLYIWLGACWALAKIFGNRRELGFGALALSTWCIAYISFLGAAHGRGGDPVPRLVLMFAAGMAMHVFRERLHLNWRLATIAAGILAIAAVHGPFFRGLYGIFAPLLFISLAYLPGGIIRRFNRFGDYSFGLYIYGFPIQQVLVHLRPQAPPAMNAALSIVLTIVPAVLSWHFVESRWIRKPSTPTLKQSRF